MEESNNTSEDNCKCILCGESCDDIETCLCEICKKDLEWDDRADLKWES